VLEPNYALHYANLAGLYWQAGETSAALDAMQQAAILAPQASFFRLNLGYYEEVLGHPEAAAAAYRTALSLSPRQSRSAFWSETPTRSAARSEWLAASGITDLDVLDRTERLIAVGQAEPAEQDLLEHWRRNRQDPLVYAGLAAVARSQGDLPLASRYLNAALWVQTLDPTTRVAAVLLVAEIAHEQGQEAEALAAYQSVYAAVTEYGSLGWWTAGWTPHASFVFQRRALPVDVLPQVVRADLPEALAGRLLPLADLYVDRGDDVRSQEIIQVLTGRDW
jgi:tetratricopeptide (TPR) repeat protein